jgi:hypothetical protein
MESPWSRIGNIGAPGTAIFGRGGAYQRQGSGGEAPWRRGAPVGGPIATGDGRWRAAHVHP